MILICEKSNPFIYRKAGETIRKYDVAISQIRDVDNSMIAVSTHKTYSGQ